MKYCRKLYIFSAAPSSDWPSALVDPTANPKQKKCVAFCNAQATNT